MARTVKTPEQKARDKARNAAIRDAKGTIRTFFKSPVFGTLHESIQDALKTLAPMARQATSTIATELKTLFADKQSLSELDVFKALKVGPNEMKARVNHCLKLADPDERMWISYDPEECIWTLENVGEMPEDFDKENLIPSVIKALNHDDFGNLSIAQVLSKLKETEEETEDEDEE